MSLESIQSEVHRFLSTNTPEILCIRGKWGVGKTYGWRKFLRAAKDDNTLAAQQYAYISLFGLNSLDDLKYSIFENTVTGNNIGKSADEATFSDLLKHHDTARKMGRIAELTAAIFNRRGVTDLISKTTFLMVRNQLICLDDLERAGKGLHVRDVLGLASYLKDQRKCKVALLLNDEEHDEGPEFERQLEKVADVALKFDLTPAEAVVIALTGTDKATELLRPRIIDLGITNIRVIKKIERLAIRLVDLLSEHDLGMVEEAVATLALASWSVQQPNLAPPVKFLRTYSSIAIAMQPAQEPLDPQAEQFQRVIKDYPFDGANALDHIVIDGAEAGYFRDSELLDAAKRVAAERKAHSRDNSFSRAWEELYHGSLATEDDVFLDTLHESAIAEAALIDTLNINSAIRLLRESDRDDQANEVIETYMAAHNDQPMEFFNLANHHFLAADAPDKALRDAFAARRAAHVDTRDPMEVLKAIGKPDYNRGEDDIALMAKQSADDFERMFEALRGNEVRRSIEAILGPVDKVRHPYPCCG